MCLLGNSTIPVLKYILTDTQKIGTKIFSEIGLVIVSNQKSSDG